mmetsp:Transcript_72856/g.199923  ORF Transcript_72856/g.199923 Transcript_72856/m.199923 type:complete len:264 (-) Transcript_72856:3197-3988(-)
MEGVDRLAQRQPDHPGRRRAARRRLRLLHWLLQQALPRRADDQDVFAIPQGRAAHRKGRRAHVRLDRPAQGADDRRADRRLEHQFAARRPRLDRERLDRHVVRALAADDRPAAAGHPVDQEARGEARPQGMSSRAEDAHGPAVAGHRERHPGDHREHPADRRRGAQPGHRPPDDQARPQPRDQAGRQGGGLPQGFPPLPADQAVQPALPARDPGGDDPGQLHGDRGRSRGPAARDGRDAGAARPRAAEGRPDRAAEQLQDQAD